MSNQTPTPKLEFILVKNAVGKFELWACRGEGKGCARNKWRSQKKQCEDCVLADEKETLAELDARLRRGDA